MASLAVGDEEVEAEEQEKVKSGKAKLLRLNKLPDDLLKYVLEFFRGDFKTLSRFLQTRKSIRNKYNSNLVVLKYLWLDIQNIRSIDGSMKEQLYKTHFYTTLIYRNIGVQGAVYLAEALKVNKTLKKIDFGKESIDFCKNR